MPQLFGYRSRRQGVPGAKGYEQGHLVSPPHSILFGVNADVHLAAIARPSVMNLVAAQLPKTGRRSNAASAERKDMVLAAAPTLPKKKTPAEKVASVVTRVLRTELAEIAGVVAMRLLLPPVEGGRCVLT